MQIKLLLGGAEEESGGLRPTSNADKRGRFLHIAWLLTAVGPGSGRERVSSPERPRVLLLRPRRQPAPNVLWHLPLQLRSGGTNNPPSVHQEPRGSGQAAPASFYLAFLQFCSQAPAST